MRELIYLSDGKLRQFLPEKRRPWFRGNVQVTTPVGGFGLEPEVTSEERRRSDQLRQVVKHIASSARWFTEEDLPPGTWIEFEAPLNHLILREWPASPEVPRMVLFADPPGPARGYGSGGAVRLLLHGSSHHLAGRQHTEEVAPQTEEVAPPRLLSERRHHDFGASDGGPFIETVRTNAGRLVDSLRAGPGPLSDEPPRSPDQVTLAEGTRDLLAYLDQQLLPETAPWTRGFARVTVALTRPSGNETIRYVVGTPLYVEYAPR